MNIEPLAIWCNAYFPEPVMATINRSIGPHRLLLSADIKNSNLIASGPDPLLEQAQIALGQPDPGQAARLPHLKWSHLTSAGYTRYDNAAVREGLARRGAVMTNSSSVYNEPCAQHVLAMMLSVARQLPASLAEQEDRAWRAAHHRVRCHLLLGQHAMIYGYGAIGSRLAELLEPLHMRVVGVRRKVQGNERVAMVATEVADQRLPTADHVINILPAAAGTQHYFDARRFDLMKRGATFYNIGRGNTVDQDALRARLESGRLAAAFLDVTDPEPLPIDHPLWSTPNCHITPHTAGGHDTEFERLSTHFLENLRRFDSGQPLIDRIL